MTNTRSLSGRFWLEVLLKELVFVSAFHQFPSGLTAIFLSLYHEKRFLPVSSSLEDHLLYRLRKEWDERKSFTSLLTDYQLSLQMSRCFPRGQNCQILIIMLGSWVSRRIWGLISRRTSPSPYASAFQVVRQNESQHTFICLSSFRELQFAALDSNYSALVSSSLQALKERHANSPRILT